MHAVCYMSPPAERQNSKSFMNDQWADASSGDWNYFSVIFKYCILACWCSIMFKFMRESGKQEVENIKLRI